jgi:hypothetical protein
MIACVDIDHPTRYASSLGTELMANRQKIQYRLEDLSGEPCLTVRYPQVTPQRMRDLHFRSKPLCSAARN